MSFSAEDRQALRYGGGGDDSPRSFQQSQQPAYLPQPPPQQQQQQHQQPYYQISQPRSPYYISSSEFHRQQPRSPFVPDTAPLQPKVRHTGTTPMQDMGGRVPRSSPLSVPTNGGTRVASSSRGMPSDRTVSGSSGVGISRSPYTPASRFFVTVIPPADLATEVSSSSSRNTSFANASSHLRRGTLMPLYPTLGGQLYAISREYGLPSIGGLTLFLCDDGEGNLGPRIGEETWPYLWGRYFDDNAEDLYHDITSPTPPHSAMANVMPYTASQSFEERHLAERNSVDSQRLTGDGDGSESYAASDSRELAAASASRPKQGSISLHGHIGGGSQSGVSPRQLMTPSPFRTVRPDWRASPASSSTGMSRLPIVARIEWAVDKMRAPWWNQWINGGAMASVQDSSRSQAQAQQQQERSTSHNRRRSMQLPKMHNGSVARSYATTQPRSPTKSIARDGQSIQETAAAEESEDEGDDDDVVAPIDSTSTSGYARLRGDEDGEEESKADSISADMPVEEPRAATRDAAAAAAARAPVETDDNLLSVDTAHDDANSGDTQSYAGFSALMGVVNGGGGGRWSAGDGNETRTSMQDGQSADDSARSAINVAEAQGGRASQDEPGAVDADASPPPPHHFDLGALEQSDEAMWQDMRSGGAARAARPFDALSASSLSRHPGQVRSSAVNEWITKTYSPSDGQSALQEEIDQEPTSMPPAAAHYDTDGEQASESEVPPEDDIAEVVGLWAEKAVEPNGVRVLDQIIVPDAVAPGGNTAAQSKRASSSSNVSRGVLSAEAGSRRSSQRSSHRSSQRSSRRAGQASQDFKLLSAPIASQMGSGEAGLEPRSESSEMAASKLSLLSPIALQESTGTFNGPSPNLTGLLLPTNTPEARSREEALTDLPIDEDSQLSALSVRIDAIERQSPPHEQDGASLETPTISSPAMLSPRLLAPSIRSPGQMSGSSSSSDMSDALIDMERALALLSPAGFQSPSPLLNREHRAPERSAFLGGSGSSGKRSRMVSNVSATESMARARHLSASVSPSLHWFRPTSNEGGAFPAVPSVTASPGFLFAPRQSMDAAMDKSNDDDGNSSVKENLPPRPASFAAAPSEETGKIAVARSTLSSNAGHDIVTIPHSAPATTVHAAQAPSDGTYRMDRSSETSGRDMVETSTYEDGQLDRFDASAVPMPDEGLYHAEESREGATAADLSIGPGIQDYDMLAQWVAAQQKQLPRSTSASPESDEQVTERVNAGTQASEHGQQEEQHVSPHLSSATPRKATTYATVGVQAEIESSDRSSAQFSLVSDDATSESERLDGGADDVAQAEDALGVHFNSGATPRGIHVAEFDPADTPRQTAGEAGDGEEQRWSASQFVHSISGPEQSAPTASDTQDEHTAFEHLIRGSFAGSISDMFSSKAVSPREPDSELSTVPTWLHGMPPSSEDMGGDGLVKSVDSPASLPHDDSTTTRGGASTNRNSTLSADEEWSQDGGEYDEEEAEQHGMADIDGVMSGINAGDDHLLSPNEDGRRESRLSDYSSLVESTDHQIGGHTPTFLYDRHLTADDDEAQTPSYFGARGLSPMSAERRPRTSTNTVSSVQSRDDCEAPDTNVTSESSQGASVVDGLGIGMASPTARAPMPSFEAILERHRIVSLAGEPMNELDEDHMPSGFEAVQSPIRATAASQSNRSLSTDEGDGEQRRGIVDANGTPTLGTLPSLGGVETGEGVSRSSHLRRSMGSISDRKQKDGGGGSGGVDMRRASTSTAAAAKTALTVASPPVRRGSPRPMLRTGLAIRRSMSPMNNPRQRFAALPPSPSLQNNAALSRAAATATHSHGSPPDLSQSSSITAAAAPYNGSPTSVPPPYGPSPRRVGSPLIIDTGRAQNTVPARKFMIAAPSTADAAPDIPSWQDGSPPMMGVQSPPTMPPMITPTPRKGSLGAVAATPPSPRGPRALPLAAPPVSVMPTSAS